MPYTAAELDDSRLLLELLAHLDQGGLDDDELRDALLIFAAEPLTRSLKQQIGPERLSVERLRREAAACGCDADDASITVYIKYGFRLEWLPHVVEALEVPEQIETDGEHIFSGEEAVLLLLRRFRSTDPLRSMTWETGRSISAISEIVWYMVEHIHSNFPHLIDERSFTSWAPHFHEFADAFENKGIPIPNLIGFIDGKLWPVCKPGMYQHVLYSGHKRIHGLKTQGLIFPNGAKRECVEPCCTQPPKPCSPAQGESGSAS